MSLTEKQSDKLEAIADELNAAGVLPHDDEVWRVRLVIDRMHNAEKKLRTLETQMLSAN